MNTYPAGTNPPSDEYEFISIPLQIGKLQALNGSLTEAGFVYGTGPGKGKITPLSLQAAEVPKPRTIDCSGDSAWLIFHATGGTCRLPDGSVNQHDWISGNGFKRSDWRSGCLDDGAVRIAFLSPDGARRWCGDPGQRHVMVLADKVTFESCGSHGPCSRVFGFLEFAPFCDVYVLTPPAVAA